MDLSVFANKLFIYIHPHLIYVLSAVETLYKLGDTGTKQYHNIVQDRLVDKKKPLDDTTKKNKVHLFSSPKGKGKSKTQELLSAVQSDSNLFFRLYIAFQVRDGNLQEFFSSAFNINGNFNPNRQRDRKSLMKSAAIFAPI